ncbi:hypothetical protein BCR44DRAFT_41699, partial [Catenaria anguillulae PL171]
MSCSVPLARHLFHLPTLGSSSSALAAHQPQPQKKNVTGTSRSAQAIRESIAQVFWSVLIRTLLAIVVHLGVTIADFMGVFGANPHGAMVQYSLNNIASLAAASFAAPKKSNKVSSIVATVSAVAVQGAKALLTRTNSVRPPKDPTLRRPSATPSVLSTATADSTSLFIATNDPAGGAGGRRPSTIGQSPSTGNRASGLQAWIAKGQELRANAGSKPASDSLTESAKTHADMISTDFKGPHNEESRVGSSRTDDQMSARGRD